MSFENRENRPVYLHRSAILDGLRSLYYTQLGFDRFLKEESYACGYREGFEAALHSVAQMAGVSREFIGEDEEVKSVQVTTLPILHNVTE